MHNDLENKIVKHVYRLPTCSYELNEIELVSKQILSDTEITFVKLQN